MIDNRSITTRDHKVSIVFNPSSEQKIEEIKQVTSSTVPQPELEVLSELDELIGLEKVKELVFEIYAMLQINQHRKNEGMLTSNQVYHMIFKGNPGTGKTSVARIVAKLFKSMGVISKGHFHEVDRADLVGEYIGHTAQKTRDIVKKAMGGVLFIDEAYSLARGGEKDFGKESLDCLVKQMEDHKNDFILIIAGYPNEMEELLSLNSGLPSRFPIHIDFPDYTADELLKIAYKMALESEYIILPEATVKIRELIVREQEDNFNFSNARYVRNLLEKAIRNQAVRLVRHNRGKYTSSALRNLTYDDFCIKKSSDGMDNVQLAGFN